MTFVPETLRIAKEVEPILTGALLILLIIFLPGGILSLLDLRGRHWHLFKPILGFVMSTEPEKRNEDDDA